MKTTFRNGLIICIIVLASILTLSACDLIFGSTCDHQYGDWVEISGSYCDEGKLKQRTCTLCGNVEDEREPARGHELVTKLVEPTCSKAGERTVTCKNCDYSEYTYLEKKEHNYKLVFTEPTCTEWGRYDNVCEDCGYMSFDSYYTVYANHIFGDWINTTDPTCTSTGSAMRECEHCSHYETKTIPATGHSLDEGVVTKEPTCESIGEKIVSCQNCAYKKTEKIKATGHSYDEIYTAPTCSNWGRTDYICSECGHSYLHSYNTNLKAHVFGDWYEYISPKCAESGEKRRDCANCDHYESKSLPSLGHSYGDWYVTQDATCTTNGEERRDCTNCDHYNTQAIPSLEHTYGEWYVEKEATCTEDGEEKRECENCEYFETKKTSALGHSFNEVVTEPTCTEWGRVDEACENCGYTRFVSYITELKEHEFGEWNYIIDPTCVNYGEKEHSCVHCNFSEQLHAEPLGHSYGDWYVVTAPTCDGHGEEKRHCAVCQYTETNYLTPLGHSYKEIYTEPTCSEWGRYDNVCERCNYSYLIDYDTNLKEHEMGEWYVSIEPGCTTDGENRRDCANCGQYETTSISPLGHSYKEVITESTCSEWGRVDNVCENCDDSYLISYDTTLKNHKPGNWYIAVEPTCTTNGENRRDCANCDYYEIIEIPAINHVYGAWHVIEDATCSEIGRKRHDCINCGYHELADIPATGNHIYGEWYYIITPTCTTYGEEQRDCVNCSYSENRHAEQTEHSLGEWIVTIPPDCTSGGKAELRCTNCSYHENKILPPNGHSYGEWYVSISPTCDFNGEEKRICENCHHSETNSIDPIGHSYETKVISPDCTTEGCTVHTCSACGNSYTDNYVAALGHIEVIDEAVTPTCTTTGLTEGKHCSVCGEVIVAQTVVPALSHTEVVDAVVAPTCTTTGLTEGKHCSVCNEVLIAQVVIPVIGHTSGNVMVENNVDPTCTTNGSYDNVVYCTVCDAELSRKTVIVDALGHTEVVDKAVTPTCTKTGLTEGKHCSVCNEILVAQTVVAALGHTEVVDKAVDPTCTATGLTEGKHCSVCNEVLVAQTVVAALGHTEVIDKTVAPICTTTGLTEGKHCSVCNEVLVTQTVVAALGHRSGDVVLENNINPTCTKTGSYDNVIYCTVCDAELSRETVVVDALGHKYNYIVTNPTCTTAGYTTYTCSVCGDSYVDDHVDVLGHTEVIDEAVSPTCTTPGLSEGSHCDICKAILIPQIIIPAGHVEVIDEAVEPTCTTTGLTEGSHCSRCGEVIVSQEVVSTINHNYIDGNCKQCGVTSDEYFTFTLLEDDTYSVKAKTATNMPSEMVIPSKYNNKVVSTIDFSAFSNSNQLQTVVIPNSITFIDERAFESCSLLANIVIPNSVTSIGSGAFYNTAYYNNESNWVNDVLYIGNHLIKAKDTISGEYVIREGTITIADSAFYNCISLSKVVIPDGVVSIGNSAFWSCGITNVIIPDSVTFIGSIAFLRCYLTNITVDENNQYYKSIDGNLYSKDEGTLIQYARGKTNKTFAIPNNVTTIGDDAFRYCDILTNIMIPDSVTSIGYYAFQYCDSLTSIMIPDSVTSIGYYAFNNCDSLASVVIGKGIAKIDSGAFSYNNLKNVYYVGTEEEWAKINIGTYNSSLTNRTLRFYHDEHPIEEGNFWHWVDGKPIAWCNEIVTSEAVASTCTKTGLTEGKYCSACGTVFVVQEVVDVIDHNYVDGNCEYCSVTSCEYFTFTLLSDDTYSLKVKDINNIPSVVVIPNIYNEKNITSIGIDAFYNCTKITSIMIPDSVVIIGEYAFDHCTNLSNVIIGNNVTIIDYYAFKDCSSLTRITIPSSVTSIGDWAFYGCSSLAEIVIPDSVTSIGYHAFSSCDNLISINVNINNPYYKSIDDNLYNKEGTIIIQYAIGKPESSFRIPDNVIAISNFAFSSCNNLINVVIPHSVSTIGSFAFDWCNNLSIIYYMSSKENWNNITIDPDNSNLTNLTRYYYSENHPTEEGNFWRYVDGVPTVWCNEIVTSEAVAPTCTITGLTEGKHCSACGTVIVAQETVDMSGHNFIDGICTMCGKQNLVATPNEYFTFALLEDDTYSIVAKDVDNMPAEVIIPDTYNGKAVTIIGERAFYDCDSLTSMVIPDSITSIGKEAFYHCESITSVVIGDSVTSISDDAFYDCDILTNVIIPDSVTSIGEEVFYNTGYYCDKSNWIDGVLYIGNHLIKAKETISGEYVIKDGTITIADRAFAGCNILASITIPNSVISIGNYTFYNCDSLTSVVIPDSVTSIGWCAFWSCSSLISVMIPDSVIIINDNAFNDTGYYCDASNWIDGVLYIGNHLIQAKSTLSGEYVIKGGTITIANDAFRVCSNLTSVVIPDSVTYIGYTFGYYCSSLTSIAVDKDNLFYKSIDGNLYSKDGKTLFKYAIGKDDTSFEIPSSVTYIGYQAFYNCDSLTSVVIPDSITSIGKFAFENCDSLNSVVIPDSVTSIGNRAFNDCFSLTNITVNKDNQYYKSIDGNLYSKDGTTLIQYAIDKADISLEIPSSVTYITDYAFDSCSNLTSVVIGDSVTSIGSRAFWNCSSLTSVVIGDSTASIGSYAFYSCENITNVVIGNSVTSIGYCAFAWCDSLTNAYYTGTEEEWANITIDSSNSWLTNATIHYNYVPE